MLGKFVLVVVWFSLFCLPLHAGTFHVSIETGDDGNPGSPARPWKTIQKAAAAVEPGDRVVIHGGVYREDRFRLGPAGRGSGERTVYVSAPGERVLLTRVDGTPPGFGLADYVRVEGLWIGGRWTKEEKLPICGVGGSPIGRGKQLIGCTIFGYTDGILVGSSEDLLIQGCRIVHCGHGRFSHGIITRNFISGFYWDLVLSGSDHLVAHNTLWRNTGQPGREPGWNAWLPAERVVLVNNVLNAAIPIFERPGPGATVSHNAYLSAAPHASDAKPFDLRNRDVAVEVWIRRIDTAVAQIDAAFGEPVERIDQSRNLEQAFEVLREPPPASSGLLDVGLDLGLVSESAKANVGRTVTTAENYWETFHRWKLRDFDDRGQERKGGP